MVTPSRRSASFYCYVLCLKLFIIVSSNSLYTKIHEIVVPLFYDVISKCDIIASTHMVAIGFSILHGECKLAFQMASTEKLKTWAVIKFRQQQGDTPSKTLKESAATHRKHAVSRIIFFDWHTHFREGTTSINDYGPMQTIFMRVLNEIVRNNFHYKLLYAMS